MLLNGQSLFQTMIQDYSRLVERIAKASGKEVEEINRLVEAKRAKLSGLISREGAAQIIASELNISFEKEKLKICELLGGMKKVNTIGKITKIFPVREYKKETRSGKVANIFLADDTGSLKTVFWDTNHISLIENGDIKEGDVIEVSNGMMRDSELHLTSFSDVKKSSEVLENVKNAGEFYERKIGEYKVGENVKTRAVIVQLFEPRFFEVCPECKSKVTSDGEGGLCEKHGRVAPVKKALLSVVVDDGSGNIRSVLFSEGIEKLGLTMEDLDPANFPNKKMSILGREGIFSGNIRQNKLFNNLEFFVNGFEDINIDSLIEQLEKK